MDFNRVEPTCYITYFPYASSGQQNGAFPYIVLRVMRLRYTLGLILFSNCAGISRVYLLILAPDINISGRDATVKIDLVPFSVSQDTLAQWETHLHHITYRTGANLIYINP